MKKDFNLYKEILENLNEGIYFVDKERIITFWNKAAEKISGFKANEIVGRHCFDNILNHVDDDSKQLCKDGCPLHETLTSGKHREASVFLQHKDGHRVAVEIKTIPLEVDSEIIGAVEVFVDNNKQAQMNAMLDEFKTLALYDQLTELPNRRCIDSSLLSKFREYEDLGIPFAIAMMDLDHFKNVNDTYGHDTGDLVLQMVAKTLISDCRQSDMVGRWGGEEFIAILTSISEDELSSILERIRVSIETSVLRNGTHPINVTISIGSTFVKKGDTVSLMQKRADYALYISKENGRNRVTIL